MKGLLFLKGRNRTIVGLKAFQWREGFIIPQRSQSHHSGIEMGVLVLLVPLKSLSQSHHSGIEIRIMSALTYWLNQSQSHHSGIEIIFLQQRPLICLRRNRTIVGLKLPSEVDSAIALPVAIAP